MNNWTRLSTLILSRVTLVLKVRHTIVSITLACFSALLGIGFILGDPETNTNYSAFTGVSKYLWAAVFLSYSIAKAVQSLSRVPICLKAVVSMLGLWNWSFLLISFLIYDRTSIGPAEPVLFMPLMWEVAYMASLIEAYKRFAIIRRRLND